MVKKRCLKCKEIKPLFEFYKNKHCKDGYLNNCKICQSKATKKYQKNEKGKEVHRKGTKKYVVFHPKQIKAEKAVNNAIRAGKMQKPSYYKCKYCKKQAEHYHHHKGYAPKNWFVVEAVCSLCHSKRHRKIA